MDRMAASDTLKAKLHPQRFSAMSGKMAAIVGCILGESYTDPAIAALMVTTDGHVLAMQAGDIGFNEHLGGVADLERNWRALLDAADLDTEERREAEQLFRQAVGSLPAPEPATSSQRHPCEPILLQLGRELEAKERSRRGRA